MFSCIWKHCAVSGSPSCAPASSSTFAMVAERKAAWLPSFAPTALLAVCRLSTDAHNFVRTNTRVAHRATLFALLLIAAIVVMPRTSEADMRHDTLTLVTAGGEKKIDIEVARTMDEQMKGLMFRTALADTAGMLFPYDPPRELTMWMKNTYIPLDMVFIRSDGVVHRIEARTTIPYSRPRNRAVSVA